jgi:uncharacterized protein (UPF0128 family)
MPIHYEIHVLGEIDESTAEEFAALQVIASHEEMLLRGELDQAALHGVLERVRALGLELRDVQRVRPARRRPRAGSTATHYYETGEGGLVIRNHYEIRVVGTLGPAAREAFASYSIDNEPAATVVSATLDQDGLHEVLDHVRALGLELVDVKQVPPSRR